jgi:hypothetical protein
MADDPSDTAHPSLPDPVCEQSRRSPPSIYDAEAILQDLATGDAHPVRRHDTLEVMRELRAHRIVGAAFEAAQSSALRMARREREHRS